MDVLMCGICGTIYTADKEQYKAVKEIDGKEQEIFINAGRLGNFNKRTGQWTALASDNDICPDCAKAIDEFIENLAGEKKIKYHKAKDRKKKHFKPTQTTEVEKDKKESEEDQENVTE